MAWVWGRWRMLADREFSLPLEQAAQVVDQFAAGDRSGRITDSGAPAVRVLSRRLNDTLGRLVEDSRQSQAQLLSVEVAFDRIHSVLHSLVEGVIVVDDVGDVVLANPAARRFLVQDPIGIEGRALTSLLAGDLGWCVSRSLRSLDDGGKAHCRHEGIGVGDFVFDIDVVRVSSNRNDQDFGCVVVIADVTERYAVCRLKDEFLSSVSHELRTPLTSICAYVEILEQMDPGAEEEWQDFLQIIGHESGRLSGLVDNLLDFLQLKDGRIEWLFNQCSLESLVDEALEAVQSAAKAHSIEIECRRSESSITPTIDRSWILKVFINLLDNAIKFSPEGGEVRIDAHLDGDTVTVEIHDNGPGLPAEDLPRVFESLSQLGDTMTDKPSGTGLGLPLSQGIVESHGGGIEYLGSDLGGACFRVTLPLVASSVGQNRNGSPSHHSVDHR